MAEEILVASLVNLYTEVLAELRRELENNGKTLDMGTTEWLDVATINHNRGGVPVPGLSLQTSGRCFLGKAD